MLLEGLLLVASKAYIIKISTLLWSAFYNPSIHCAIRGMLLVASNSYIIRTLLLLGSIFYSLSINCAIRGMLLVVPSSRPYHFYGLLFTGCCQ